MNNEEGEIKEKTRVILEGMGRRRENLIPILQKIQEELGYLPLHAMLEAARFLNIPEIDVYSVATFYNQFRLTPPGKHSIRVCMGTACHVKGGDRVLDVLKRTLGVEPGETTTDNRFTLEVVRCVGCCGLAPVVVVDDDFHGKMNLGKVQKILKAYG